MIYVQELIHDPDFCDTFQLIRHIGSEWERGEQIVKTETLTIEGIVSPATSKDIEMLPEGDRQTGMKTFYADVPMHVTDTEETSDICEYRGKQYKLLQVFDYSSNGYYKAIGTMTGDADGI